MIWNLVALARLPVVFDLRHEARSRGRALRGVRTLELRRGGGEFGHEFHLAIEVHARDMVQVVEMAAAPHPRRYHLSPSPKQDEKAARHHRWPFFCSTARGGLLSYLW